MEMILYYWRLFKRSPIRIRRLTYVLGLSTIVLIVGVVLLIRLIHHLRAPALSAEEKVKELVEEVGKAVVLPNGEIPTVAVVADPSKLKDQVFFIRAEVGDEVLIYTQSKEAILWRPSIKKVVSVSNLMVNQ
ncbi:hypothetical protein KW790_03400 [Candidatus Parcubacteria bacterium]|nr:hypothetical protein [Candidatus Parcubacteria bacterium]